jgi:hypothetical protein
MFDQSRNIHRMQKTEQETHLETERGKNIKRYLVGLDSMNRAIVVILLIGAVGMGWKILSPIAYSFIEKAPPISASSPPEIDADALFLATSLSNALSEARADVLTYRKTHGILPDLITTSFNMPSRKRFEEATGNGKFSITAVTHDEGTFRLIGVKGGALCSPDFRYLLKYVVLSADEGQRLDLRRFDGTPYDGHYASVYIPLD